MSSYVDLPATDESPHHDPIPPAPSSSNAAVVAEEDEGDEEAAGEDKGLDYRLLSKINKKNTPDISIPKRGEKDFEPLELGVNVQERALRDSRSAMFAALRGVRGGGNKTISHAHLPLPSSSNPNPLPYALLIRGNHFNTTGHTYRPAPSSSSPTKQAPQTVLLPEEALYLLERGSLCIWRGDLPVDAEERAKQRDLARGDGIGLVEEVFTELGARRMTVQEGWALWGQDLPQGRYNVYASLKRLGYIVHRAPQHMPTHLLPPPPYVPPPVPVSLPHLCIHQVGLGLSYMKVRVQTVWDAVRRLFGSAWARLRKMRERKPVGEDRWKPLVEQNASKRFSFYSQLFSHLRIISAPRETTPLLTEGKPVASTVDLKLAQPNPYDVYYHIWKPNGQYKKRDPGEPDFKIGVIDARSLPLPSHTSFREIFSTLPLLDPPKSRYPPRNPPPATPTAPPPPTNVFSKYLPAFLKRSEPPVEVKPKGMATNPFPTLKQGDKSFVLAVVDGGGSVSWLKFGRGLFGEWAMQ